MGKKKLNKLSSCLFGVLFFAGEVQMNIKKISTVINLSILKFKKMIFTSQMVI